MEDIVMLCSTFYVPNSSRFMGSLNAFYKLQITSIGIVLIKPLEIQALKADIICPVRYTDTNHIGTWGIGPGFIWNEVTVANSPGDRRWKMSSKPFAFRPGDKITANCYIHTANYTIARL